VAVWWRRIRADSFAELAKWSHVHNLLDSGALLHYPCSINAWVISKPCISHACLEVPLVINVFARDHQIGSVACVKRLLRNPHGSVLEAPYHLVGVKLFLHSLFLLSIISFASAR